MKRATETTPVRAMLRADSTLMPVVQEGIGAIKSAHHAHLDEPIRADFADSLDLDEAVREGREKENRWDYLLGHTPSGQVIAVEPHSARDDQIKTVIKKREAARHQLSEHLRDGATISKWLWVASGRVKFAPTEKAKVQLDQNGIEFVGRVVRSKHLPSAGSSVLSPASKGRRTRAR